MLSNRPVTFLFWNLGKKDLAEAVVAAVAEHGVDILILAEAEALSIGQCIVGLNRKSTSTYQGQVTGSNRLTVISRLDGAHLQHIATLDPSRDSRWAFHKLLRPGKDPVLIVSVHLRSKLAASENDQYARVRRLSEEIVRVETTEKTTHTVVVGDFNMDPFEIGMQACDGMHALLSKHEIAVRRGSRIHDTRSYRMFFNPAWRLHGEQIAGPPGSYHYAGDGVLVQYWHLFDQVLVRPELIEDLSGTDIRVLDAAGGESLLDHAGRPDRTRFSDHLPLLFRLRI